MTDLKRTLIPLLVAATAVLGTTGLGGCRGGIKKKPPIHPVLDMDFQQKLKPQMAAGFAGWDDDRAMRLPPAGTVARGSLVGGGLAIYKDAADEYVDNPVQATMEVLHRGRERFNIFCAVCHSRTGDLEGIVLQRAGVAAFAKPPQLSREPRLVEAKDGYLYQVITIGQGTMPAYAHQISVEDRWAVVHYLRVLQSRYQ